MSVSCHTSAGPNPLGGRVIRQPPHGNDHPPGIVPAVLSVGATLSGPAGTFASVGAPLRVKPLTQEAAADF